MTRLRNTLRWLRGTRCPECGERRHNLTIHMWCDHGDLP